MKRIRLVRHGESAANAGAASHDHASIPLTEKGLQQAQRVANSIAQRPSLIIVSPFSRAQATAARSASLFPSVPVEIWPIEEFTYLEPSKCANTTVIERKAWVEQYWANADPGYVDGFGAESFLEFVGRAQSFLYQLAENPAVGILIFSHGQFLNLVAWLIERKPVEIDGQAITEWRRYEIDSHVPKGYGYIISLAHADSPWVLDDSIGLEGSVRPSGLASSI